MIKAPVHKIIHHSLVDGPGNRTSIFLQGCNIRCEYCHNPETQKILEKGEALDGIQWLSPEEVFEEVKKDIPFIRGITVSGGECGLFPEFLEELFRLAKNSNLTCLLDSNGTIDWEKYPGLMEVTSGVMLDVKAWDREIFKALTGSTNEVVKKNLSYLARLKKLEEIRIVCLEEEVDVPDILHGIKETIGSEGVKVRLIKFRNNGVVARFKNTESPSEAYMARMKSLAHDLGFIVIKN